MLVVEVQMGEELFDEEKSEFVFSEPPFRLRLQHSLVSLSKWEESFERPFLNNKEKTSDETVAYIKAMCIDEEIPPEVFSKLSAENFADIQAHITAKKTATWFSETAGGKASGEIITSELIYYWMIAFNIPSSYETWHLSRLLTLIRICQHKNTPAKKMSKAEIAQRQRELNAKRRAEMKTTG
jgi:hypothetical protein